VIPPENDSFSDARDPLSSIYRNSQVVNPAHFEYLYRHSTALLSIDLQYLDAARGEGIFRDVHASGIPLEWQEYYFDRLEKKVIPNVQRLQECFRRHELEVIHTRIQSLTRDGRDRSQGHKRLKIHAPPGSREAEILDEVAPIGDEIVVNKTTSGVFSSTNFNYVLTNIGIRALYVVGVYTNECVETTVRDACDLGYFVTIVSDACATVTEELHEASLKTLRDRYARIVTTEEALADIERFVVDRNEWMADPVR
jgi:nicotinamidase-related amidase